MVPWGATVPALLRSFAMPRIFALAFLLLAVLHLHWAFGGHWPAPDSRSLARLVVGGQDRMPSRFACTLVALGLLLPLPALLAPKALPPGVASWILWGTALVLLLRGVTGLFETRLRPAILGDPYAHWNARLYSPFCLILALGLMLTALTR